MIYRVGENENNTYDYNKLKLSQSSGSEEQFSLDYQDKPSLSSKQKEDKEDGQPSSVKSAGTRRELVKQSKSGVTLELSNAKAETDDKARQEENGNRAAGSILPAGLREIFHNLLRSVKEIFDRIWNDQPPDVQSEDVTPEEAERYTQEYLAMKGLDTENANASYQASDALLRTSSITEQSAQADWPRFPDDRDAEIQKYLRSGNLEQVMSLLTENGHKTIARNSNLLTYYDKTGKLTQINPSDRERILHGDRNTKKL
ncbi:MAG: hypothetical protein J6A08_04195 [Lachnospiraceae bacterium]|nr:hypothetical protein [Lachnospiraceae bacterium]